MKTNFIIPGSQADRLIVYSDAEKTERRALGLPAGKRAPGGSIQKFPKGRKLVSKKIITEPKVLNEASEYGAAFVRGLRVDLPGRHVDRDPVGANGLHMGGPLVDERDVQPGKCEVGGD